MDTKDKISRMEPFWSIFRLSGLHRLHIILLTLCTLAATIFEGVGIGMVLPVLEFVEKGRDVAALAASGKHWRLLLDAFAFVDVKLSLLALLVCVMLLLLLRQVFTYARAVYANWILQFMARGIQAKGFSLLIRSELDHMGAKGAGESVNVLTVDCERGCGAVISIFNLLSTGTILMLYFGLLLWVSTQLTLAAVLILAVVSLAIKNVMKQTRKLGKNISQHNESLSSVLIERINGLELIKLSASEEREEGTVRAVSHNLQAMMYKVRSLAAAIELIIDPLVMFSMLSILYVGVDILNLPISSLGLFMLVMLRLLPYTKNLFLNYQALQNTMGSLERVSERLEEARLGRTIGGGSLPFFAPKNGLFFKGVTFSHKGSRDETLSEITFSVPANRMTAVVGPSGSGKSSLLRLIPRLYLPDSGEILLDDTPLSQLDLQSLRKGVGVVSQEVFLMNDTIANNIRYSRPTATDSEVAEAADRAFATNYIKNLPLGFATVIGPAGFNLSGGERQRIALARALCKGAPILILDEPTSSLDSESEQFIQLALDDLRLNGNLTMIVVAHRLSTVRNAEKVVILNNGRLVNEGGPDLLDTLTEDHVTGGIA